VWYVEMVWCVGLWAILFFTRRVFLFSTAAYFCFFVWMVLQVVGAHFTFEHVPMDWLTKPLGLVRNPYDRIAHFAVGWFAFPIAELFHRRGWTRSAGFAAFFAVASIVALAGIWELVEWIYAVLDGGDAGAAFLGSQGDVWDAQKDILCDTLGALCASGAFLWRVNRSPSYWMRATHTSAKEHVEDRIAHILLAFFLWPMLLGIIVAVLLLERGGVFSRWWVGVLLAFAAFKLGKGTGIFREWPPKGWWKYESSTRRSQKQRGGAKEKADGKT
jgi:putative membrane protein